MKAGDLDDTIVALSTGQGVAAISVIRLSGPKAIMLAGQVFKGKRLDQAQTHTLQYGRIVDEEGAHLDDVVVGIFRGPKSFTGEDMVEISCHGSPYIVREVINLLIRRGARPAAAGEFTMRAFLHGRLDLSQAEAVADLIAANSRTAHDLAVQQLRGGVSSEIKLLRQNLIDFASLIELELDFSEEDVEFADRPQLQKLVRDVIDLASRLRDTFRLGNAIRQGIPTVIAGRPNAGKSTLLNRLLREERAIVSDIPGTTRDTIEEILIIDGLPFRLIDTAGIREAHDEIEAIGIGRTMEKIGQASILIYVFDIRATSPEEVLADVGAIAASTAAKVLLVANKIDLDPDPRPSAWAVPGYPVIPLSALQERNIPRLLETLANLVRADIPTDIPLITSSRHYHALDRTVQSLQQVLSAIGEQLPGDLIAQDLRQAIWHLSEITGEISSEDILGNIFGKFCIGK